MSKYLFQTANRVVKVKDPLTMLCDSEYLYVLDQHESLLVKSLVEKINKCVIKFMII